MSPKTSSSTPPTTYRLAATRLRWRCDPEHFSFKTTDEMDKCPINIIGQDRAMEAL